MLSYQPSIAKIILPNKLSQNSFILTYLQISAYKLARLHWTPGSRLQKGLRSTPHCEAQSQNGHWQKLEETEWAMPPKAHPQNWHTLTPPMYHWPGQVTWPCPTSTGQGNILRGQNFKTTCQRAWIQGGGRTRNIMQSVTEFKERQVL